MKWKQFKQFVLKLKLRRTTHVTSDYLIVLTLERTVLWIPVSALINNSGKKLFLRLCFATNAVFDLSAPEFHGQCIRIVVKQLQAFATRFVETIHLKLRITADVQLDQIQNGKHIAGVYKFHFKRFNFMWSYITMIAWLICNKTTQFTLNSCYVWTNKRTNKQIHNVNHCYWMRKSPANAFDLNKWHKWIQLGNTFDACMGVGCMVSLMLLIFIVIYRYNPEAITWSNYIKMFSFKLLSYHECYFRQRKGCHTLTDFNSFCFNDRHQLRIKNDTSDNECTVCCLLCGLCQQQALSTVFWIIHLDVIYERVDNAKISIPFNPIKSNEWCCLIAFNEQKTHTTSTRVCIV